MYILLFLFILVVFILVLGLSIVGSIVRAIFVFGRRSTSRMNQSHEGQNNQSQEENTTASGKRKKLFTKDEGEYVDYEEVKDK